MNRLKRSVGLRLVAFYGAAFVVSMALIAALSLVRVSVVIEQVIQAWGETVAQQLAQSTLDAAMQKDSIALQAHLGRLLKAEGLVSASVYDVQNTLLAQAGAMPRELSGRAGLHSFPATLALGDNAIGRVVVIIDASKVEKLHRQLYWIMIGGGVLAMLLLAVVSYRFARQTHALHRQLSMDFITAMPSNILPAASAESHGDVLLDAMQYRKALQALAAYVEQLQSPSPSVLLAAASDLINPDDACAYVLFEVRKLEVLQRQVSRDRLRSVLKLYQQHIENVCRLYGAQRVPVTGACIKIIFPTRKNHHEAAFQAACLAYVMAGLLRDCVDPEMGMTLQWAVALDWHSSNSDELLRNLQRSQDEKRSHWLCEQVGSMQLACSAELADQLKVQDKLELIEASGDGGRLFYRFGNMVESHHRMLERQIEQMRTL